MGLLDLNVPAGFSNIEEWILFYMYGHPKDDHSTHSLRDQLAQVLKDEPSRLDEFNKIQRMFKRPDLSAEEYEPQRQPAVSDVQRAVETLIEQGSVNGKLESDENGAIFFSGIKLRLKGTREAIRGSRAREAKANPVPSFESTLKAIHERKDKESHGG